MEINEAPTFHALNKAQKRALILRDQLRYTDTGHLDTFIDGIARDEPPSYKRINGIVQPALVMVTLKDTAIRFDLGNVQFKNDVSVGTGVYRAHLTVEDGRFELRTDEALPADEADLHSVPIHVFIAKTMVPMFEAKFRAIWDRKNKINEIRQVAFDLTSQAVEQFEEGETLARLDFEHPVANGTSSQPSKPKKRQLNELVVKHYSNKRKRVGLESISQEAKAATFNSIPDQIKVDLFNNVVKTAFPNFDNLIIASWNVVSIYSNVGTDFPELHKSIVELKSVLQDFEELVGTRESRDEPRYRQDFAPQEETNATSQHRSARPTPNTTQNDTGNFAKFPHSISNPTAQQQRDADSLFIGSAPGSSGNDERPPPRILQKSKRPRTNEEKGFEVIEGEPKPKQRSSILHSSPRSTPEYQLLRKPSQEPSSAQHSPGPKLPCDRTRKDCKQSIEGHQVRDSASSEPIRRDEGFRTSSSNDTSQNTFEKNDTDDIPKPRSYDELSLPALRQLYSKHKHELIQKFGGNQNVPQQYRMQMQELSRKIKAREQKQEIAKPSEECVEEPVPTYPGNSVLGGKKPLGTAPVAPMVHLKKEGGSNGNGNRNGAANLHVRY